MLWGMSKLLDFSIDRHSDKEVGPWAFNRRSFVKAGAAFAAAGVVSPMFASSGADAGPDYDKLQLEIDLVSNHDYRDYLMGGGTRSFAALERLDAAFDKVMREFKETKVTDYDKPAIWYLYNVGIIVKTVKCAFAIDLHHRRAVEFAPFLDFALITHNHGDHYNQAFYRAMNSAGKTVISNFLDNYGVKNWMANGGYTRKPKTFVRGDVKIKTGLTDHNDYLVDYTTFFEIHIGAFTICHSGDCSNYKKLNFTRRPDLWVVHPYCQMDVAKGSTEKVKPKCVVIAHLQELSHAKDRWRWTYKHGLDIKDALAKVGVDSIMPLWGDRIY